MRQNGGESLRRIVGAHRDQADVEIAAELRRQLESLVATFRSPPQAGELAPLSEEEEELLRQLGYGAAKDD